MFSKARSLLARLRPAKASRSEEARFDGQIEELEPRILFSADAAGVLGLLPDTAPLPAVTRTLQPATSTAEGAAAAVTRHEVAFIDASLPNARQLADLLQKQGDANRTLSIYWLDASSDGVKQISDVMSTLQHVDAVHILSHGSDGNLLLGNATLNAQTLSQYAGNLASWQASLNHDADLMLYGCDLAQDAAGQSVVKDIRLLTGANVAASTDLTGDSGLGGDWVLEYQLGQIDTGVALDPWQQADWHGLLATYTVTNTSDSGAGSLRAAITSANGNAGTDTINFNISSGTAGTGSDTGAYVITLSSALPQITGAVTIDASTQSGYVAGGLHTVVLDGNDAGAYGLDFNNAADGSTVRGLVIRNFTSYGIYNESASDGNTFVGNFIGSFYADGSNAGTGKGNATAGIVSYGANTVIGGTTTADRNVISGNSGGYNIYMATGADGTVIKGNYIGTNAAGTSIFSTTNPNYGIMIETSATNITIGGTTTGAGNVVSGHTARGMWITTTGTVTIQGNYVGTDYTGTVDLGNTTFGIYLDDTGTATIGGATVGAGNVISGNNGGGIYASNTSDTIQGNIIGLDATGTAALGNTGAGIEVRTSGASTIGGSAAGAGNVISGNTTYGIDIESHYAHVIKGNYIGVGSNGTTLLGNGSHGIYVNTSDQTIGGKNAGDGNIIAGNGGDGISVVSGTGTFYYRNSIYSNTGLGIDLNNDGVTVNDYGDGDGGPNYQNNYPVIASAIVNGSSTTITGSIDWYAHSTADTIYIELFSSPSLDPSGNGEGKTYLGQVTVTTDPTTGDATFSTTVTGVSAGDYITAVANVETSFTGASEFSVGLAATTIATAPKGKLIWTDNDQLDQWVSNWTGSAFTAPGMTGLNLSDDVTMMTVAEAPTRNEFMMIGSADASGVIEVIVWNGSTWSAPLGIPVASPSAAASQYNSFGLAYESQSGDALLVWDNGTTGTAGLSYAVWNGTSWSATSTITAPSSGEPLNMKLVSNPIADGMVLVATTNTGNNNYAIVWNGSSWGNSQTLGTNSNKQYFEINAAYESQTGHAVVVYDASASDSSSLQYRTWNGSSWSSEGTIAAPSGTTAGSDVYCTAIASDPTSNRVAVAVKDAANEVYVSIWDGSAWGNAKTMTTSGIDSPDHHATMAVAFESLSGDLLVAYGKAAGPNVYYQTWSSGGGWSAEQTGPSMGGTDITYSLKLYSDPYSNTIMMADQDGGLDLNMVAWDGSAWGSVTTVDANTNEYYRENYAFAWDRYTPPSLTNISGDTLAYTEDGSATVIDQGTVATASDGDGIGYTGGNLTVTFTAGSTSSEDVLSIRNQGTGAGQIGVSGSNVTYAGTIIGTYTGGSSGVALVITLNSAASNAAVGALANNITYVNTNTSAPSTTSRTVRYSVTNARGLSSPNYDNTITVSAVNDAPTATITPLTYSATEQTSLILHGTGISIDDVDAGSATVQATLSVVSGTLTVSAGTTGVTVTNSGTSSVTLSGTITQINNLLAGSLSGSVSYIINSDAPPATDTLTLSVNDQGNSGSGGAKSGSDTATINITAVNDAPVITSNGGGASASVNTAENTSTVTTVTATDPDAGATQTYSITGGADAAKFSINSATGVLTFVSAPDYENPTDAGGNNVYDVIVQVSDGTLTDSQAIAVTVTDVNDNAPVITSDGGGASATKNVAENGTAVTTVTATDVDTGTTLTYSITGGADAAKFSINSSTGVLTFVSAPDYENPTDAGGNNVYDVTVQVSDGTNTDTQAIAVAVTDVNDNAPVITSDGGGASATKNVAENGTAVTTVTATDVDTGTTLTYSISGGADAAKFSINSSTGVLTFVSAPDYETPTDAGGDNVYDVTVQVSDGSNTDTQAIAVTVTDVNDNAPVITSDGGGASATKNVAENGTAVTTVTATDVDTGTTLSYSITGGADAAKFSINSSTGVLTFVSAPDYENPTDAGGNNVYDVTVQVSDGTNTDTQAIAVTVTDVNDNAPVITSDGGGASATKNVAENGTAVTTVTATDVETGTTLTYSITGGADAAKFSINSSTGVLTFVSAPDYENPTDAGANNVYDVTVQVSDGTNTDSQAIAVTVTDVNDNAPVITSDGGGASATKNVAENGTAVTTVTATDVDTGTTLTYSITGGADAAKFSINSSTGVLTFVSAPDYENPTDAGGNNVYDVTVQVTDGTNTDTQAIAVTVTDVNDNAPVITSDGNGTSATKNVAENSTAVTTVTATDVDTGTTLTYSITGGADAAKFSINSSTGVLTFVSTPDYEGPTDAGGDNVYDVTVQVSDGTNTDTQAIAVTVTDVNDNAPVITSDGGGASATKNVAENGTAVTTVTATDVDTGTTLTYSITGGADAAKFSINSSTGVLTFVSAPDYEAPTDAGGNNVYDVTVQVSDGTNTDTQAIAVTVTDVNDNVPIITSDGSGTSATKNVAENGTAVTTVTATDADTGTTLTYSITGGSDAAKFSINSSTGVLTFVSAPDYENPTDAGGNNVYDVTVQVSDGTNTDTQAIAVTVTDVNDNAPAITSDGGGASATKNVAENSTAVTTVTATDVDTGTTLTYSITGGADAAKFSINSSTGVLTFVSAPDYENPTDAGGNNVYDVTVQVSDGTDTDTQAIAVNVTDANDNAPVITSDGGSVSATTNIAENGTAVTTVTATDVDTGTTLTYSITGGADAAKFSINSSTGVLTFVSAPDHENPTDAGGNNVYDVTVQVSDGTNTDTQAIAVTVTDVNDNAPVITSDGGGASATTNVAENGTAVTTVTATDSDSGSSLTYSITGGADAAKFSINSSTGELTFVSPPDYETPTDAGGNNVYDVTVQVSDGTNADTQAIAVTVTDVNDNAPVITSDGGGASATTNIAENGTAVTTVTATDVDTGTTLTYSITGGADAAKFLINSSTGVLTFVSAPDYESPTDAGGNNVYDVTVQVSDGTNTDTQAIAVTVTDVNDNAPVITSDGGGASATANIAENSTAVTTVTATDADAGSTLTYSITGGADAAKFSINSSTGALTFVSAPDHENPTDAGGNNVYDVTVQVSDGTNTDTQAIAITVTDVNDNAPVITSDGGGASATKSIAENGTAATTVTATDADAGASLTYSITGGADAAKFSINSSTGVLTFVSAPDYEAPTDAGGNNVYDVTVQVSDGTNTDTQAIAITVTDVNDNAPFITSDGGGTSATKNVAENSTAVTTVTATDVDTGTTLTYSIAGGADANRFSINSSTGVLTFVSAPDYENPTDTGGNNVYDVTVQVSDGANTDAQAIAVTVTDVNDNAPVITSDGGGASATKNVAENGTAITTVTATDVDTGTTLTYSITGGADAAKFSINSSTGALTFVSAPDHENPTDAGGNNVYDVTVQVSDGTHADTQAIAVTVTDVNDNAPVITSDGGGASATKNVAENGSAVTTVTATDVDTSTTLTYSITGGADAAKFSINSSTGVLTFVSAPDYETPTDAGGNNVYDVTVQVSDGTNTDTQAIAVTVTDLNDNAPVIISDGGGASAMKNVAENGTAITTVTATDVDTGTALTYSITGGADAAKFSINSSTGVLTFASAPDYEHPTDAGSNNVYDVTVQVSDGTNTDTQAIAVTVTDVNDNAPVITSNGGGASATTNVAENGSAVTTVTATDADSGSSLTYSITGGADAAKFSINSSTGALTFVSAPDYENPTDAGANNVYDVTVQVSDGTNTDTQAMAITVTGVNESPTAQINQGSYSATEKVALTLQGTGMQITDPDALSGVVQVQLSVNQGTLAVTVGNAGVSVTGSGSNTVSITGTLAQINQLLSGSSTGTISYVNNHDAPAPTDTLTLTVDDLGNTGAGTALSSSATATINVTPVNDSPIMSAITLTANAAPSTSWSNSVLLNGASDPDGDLLTVRVLQGPQHGTLSINGSGQVTYTTNAGYVGSDSFSYVAFDGQASSNVRVMSIQASSPLVDIGPGSNTPNTDSPPTKVDTTTKNDSDTSTPKPGKPSEPKPAREEPIVVAPPAKADATDSGEQASVGALLHHLTNSAWTPARISDSVGAARQIFFTPPAGTYVTATVSNAANAPSVMQLLDLIKPNLEHIPDINLSVTPLSSVTHALPAGRLADGDAAEDNSGRAPIRLTKIATYSSGLGLSIGTIWWTARMSGLVTSALISTPAWRSLDPLPVVTSPTEEQEDEHDGDSRLGDREVEHLFDGDKPLEQDMPIIQ